MGGEAAQPRCPLIRQAGELRAGMYHWVGCARSMCMRTRRPLIAGSAVRACEACEGACEACEGAHVHVLIADRWVGGARM